MLHRHDQQGLIVISQPSHAWISGQLAANWGTDDGTFLKPSTELILAAEQHDIAWLDWETHPSLNPETGLPYTFLELPTTEHIEIWNTATAKSMTYGRLPAVLISMHGTQLYRRYHDYDRDTPDEARMARAFVEREERFQSKAIASLMADGDISLEEIQLYRRHLSLWDGMSLAICMGIDGSRSFTETPTASGESISLELSQTTDKGREFTLSPWPFEDDAVVLRCEGKRLDGTYNDVDLMRAALREAPAATLTFTLRSA